MAYTRDNHKAQLLVGFVGGVEYGYSWSIGGPYVGSLNPNDLEDKVVGISKDCFIREFQSVASDGTTWLKISPDASQDSLGSVLADVSSVDVFIDAVLYTFTKAADNLKYEVTSTILRDYLVANVGNVVEVVLTFNP